MGSAALIFLSATAALAQVQPRVRSFTVLFPPTANFQNPGARSYGLGGAFAALADDASASELNPAGLTQLRRPEIGFEYRLLESKTPLRYLDSSRAGGFECTYGTSDGASCNEQFRSREKSLSFVSLVLPSGRDLTFAMYRHEIDRERLALVRPALDFGGSGQAPGTMESLDRRIVRTGVAMAYALNDRFSAGLTLNLNQMSQSFHLTNFYTSFPLPGGSPGPPAIVNFVQDSHIDAQKMGGTAGIYWRPVRPLTIGISYSTTVLFEENAVRSTCGVFDPNTGYPACGFSGLDPDPSNLYSNDQTGSSFALPFRAGVALAWRPTTWLVVIGEGDRVGYSSNSHDLDHFDSNGDLVGLDRLSARDVWELHGGVEAAIPVSQTGVIAVRVGYWRDPDHSFRYDGCQPLPGKVCDSDLLFPVTNPPLGRRDHFAAGFGLAWSWGQVDVGYDWLKQTRSGTLAISMVFRAR